MERVIVIVALATALLAVSAHAALYTKGGMVVPSPKSQPIEGQFIVVFHGNVSDADVAGHMARHPIREVLHTYHIQGTSFRGYAGVMDEDTRAAVEADSGVVAFVEQDQTMHVQQSCELQKQATWGLVRSNQRELDIDGRYVYHTGIGEGVRAYVIDTGIYVDNVDFEGRAELGPTFVPGAKTSVDEQGHGTHVAGTIGSKTYGMAKAATLVAVQVLGADGSGSNSGVIGGIDWAANDFVSRKKQNPKIPAYVANLSLGGGYSSASNAAVNAMVKAGMAVAVAAGNDDENACGYSPASASDVITVAASDAKDARSYFSNFGSCTDIIAPGSDISSTWLGKYGVLSISGTSMASPAVAGAMVKYASLHTDADGEAVQAAVLSAATHDAIYDAKGSPNLLVYGDCA